MTPITLTLLIFAIMLVLMALRAPIAIAMFSAGTVGYVLQAGWLPLANFLNTQAFARFASYDLSVIPLFILIVLILSWSADGFVKDAANWIVFALVVGWPEARTTPLGPQRLSGYLVDPPVRVDVGGREGALVDERTPAGRPTYLRPCG